MVIRDVKVKKIVHWPLYNNDAIEYDLEPGQTAMAAIGEGLSLKVGDMVSVLSDYELSYKGFCGIAFA